MTPTPQDRRAFLRASLGLAASAAGGSLLPAGAQSSTRLSNRPAASPLQQPVVVALTAAPEDFPILPGAPTTVWRYTGQQIGGLPGALTPIPGSHLGPILNVRQGQRLVVNVQNNLPEEHVLHWHGLDVPEDMDGHPRHQFPSGGSYLFDFEVRNRAGTYWYHSHTDMRTGVQAYRGLAGVLIVGDAEERALPLPRGAFDVPIVLQDARFDSGNQLQYSPTNMQDGFLGDRILVNGKPDFVLQAATRVYRFRVVNASTSRIYKLAWSDATPMVAIGNDGGLLAAPLTLPYVTLSPGERVELWADFRNHPVGGQVVLRSLAFSGASANQGAPLDLMRVDIVRQMPETLQLPAVLSTIVPYQEQSAVNYGNPRTFPISMQMGVGFVLNGGTFGMTTLAANEIVRRDTLEVVRVTNTAGMTQVAHPIHFHGRQFQVLRRTVTAGGLAGWQTVSDGYVDAGWKDTVLLMPGESIDVLLRYSTYTGMFLYHCHNLVHEDMGMMRNYRIDP